MLVDTVPAPLRAKVAIVTGGTKGIGKAIAVEFARQGCSHIAISYRSSDPSSTIEELKTVSPDIVTLALPADINDDDFGSRVVSESLSGLGVDHIDIVVSNAALIDVADHVPATQIDKPKFDFYMKTNAWSGFSLAMSAIPHMKAPGGRVIFISSGGAKMAFGDPMVGHCFSKAALDSIAANLAMVYGKEGNLTVNSISVGATDTASLAGADAMYPGYRQMADGMSILGRSGTSEEVAQIVAFVASPAAGWINGNQVPANGGMLRVLQS